jgi:hypothetical protein
MQIARGAGGKASAYSHGKTAVLSSDIGMQKGYENRVGGSIRFGIGLRL